MLPRHPIVFFDHILQLLLALFADAISSSQGTERALAIFCVSLLEGEEGIVGGNTNAKVLGIRASSSRTKRKNGRARTCPHAAHRDRS